MILNGHESDFEILLENNYDVSNHHRKIQVLLIKIFKIKEGFSPLIMGSVLKGRENTYNVRNFEEIETERKRTVYFGLKTINYRSLQLWSLLPGRNLNSIDQFKRSLRQWVCRSCPCRLCKVYLQNIRFLQIFREGLILRGI